MPVSRTSFVPMTGLEVGSAGISDDAALGGRLRLLQPLRGHRFGHDAILLAAAVTACAGDHVVEFGAGVGAAGLALATRVPNARVTMLEIEPALAELAGRNIQRNALADRVAAITADVTKFAMREVLMASERGGVTGVMMNPPFNDAGRQTVSPDPDRARAHSGGRALLDAWIGAAARLLPARGLLTLIWRADGVGDVLAALQPTFGAIRILPIYPRPAEPAIRVIVQAMHRSATSLALLPGLALNDAAGRPTAEAEAIMRAGQPLTLGQTSTMAAGPTA